MEKVRVLVSNRWAQRRELVPMRKPLECGVAVHPVEKHPFCVRWQWIPRDLHPLR